MGEERSKLTASRHEQSAVASFAKVSRIKNCSSRRFFAMGSISGTPSFPDITGYTWDMINAELSTTAPSIRATYDSAKTAFDAANILAEQTGQALLQQRTALQTILADPTATEQEKQAAQAAYDAAFAQFTQAQADFKNKADAMVAASNAIFGAATDYVSALARQQMMKAQRPDTAVAGYLTSLVALIGTPDASTPDWLLTAVAQAAPGASAQERQAIIDAFNQYRLLEYNIAAKRQQFISDYVVHLEAYYDWMASSPPDPTLKATADNYFARASADYSQVASLISQRPATLSSLDSAVTSLGGALQSAFEYLQNGQTLTDHFFQPLSAAFEQAYEAKVAADTAGEAAYLTEYPTTNPAYVEQKIAGLIGDLEKLRGALLPSSVALPVLPPITSTLSMSDLMRIISKVRLMIQQLAQYVSMADSSIGSFNASSLLLELSIQTATQDAQLEWMALVKQADAAYNAQVVQDNKTASGDTDSTLSYMSTHTADITALLTQINSQITAWNTALANKGVDIVNACGSIDQSLIGAINDARSTYPEAPNYLDFFNFDSDVQPPQPLSPASISFDQLPSISDPSAQVTTILDLVDAYNQAIDTPTLLQDPTFCTAHNLPCPTTMEALRDLINTDLTNLLQGLAPVLDQVQALLKSDWATEHPSVPPPDFDFTKLFMRELIPPRTFPDYTTTSTLLVSFIGAVTKVMEASDLAEKDRITMRKFLSGLINIIRQKSTEKVRKSTKSPGVGFGLDAADIEPQPGAVQLLIEKLAESDILTTTLSRTVEAAAIVSGLVAAGMNIAGMSSSMGISSAELFSELNVDQTKFLNQQSMQALLFAFSQQLALFAEQTPNMKQNVLNILSQIPGGGNLTADQVKEVLASLLMLQQFLLLFMSMLMASLGGMSSAQFMTQVLGKSGGDTSTLLNAFQSLGLPEDKAVALGTALGGSGADLQGVLRSTGLDEGTSTVILALIAAQEGNISLTEGVMGGPAYLDALLKRVQGAGIALTARIGTPEFMAQLVGGLEARSNPEQAGALKAALTRIGAVNATGKAPTESLSLLVDELIKGVTADMAAAKKAGATPAPSAVAPIVLPSEVMAQYESEFRKLPPAVQNELLGLAKGAFTGISGLTDEQKASLLIGVRLGSTTLTEAVALAQMMSRESAGTLSYSDSETKLVSRLFRESPEAKTAREDSLKRAILDEGVRQKELLPNALPQKYADSVKQSFQRIADNYTDRDVASRVTDRFSKFVEKLSSMSKVEVLLLDPGKILLRLFSVVLTTSQDRLRQPPTLFGG